MDLGLSSKVAPVAASTKGLAQASALTLAREGGRVTNCARTTAGTTTAGTTPLGRLNEPIELGNFGASLGSERASYIPGAFYRVDGGVIGSNV